MEPSVIIVALQNKAWYDVPASVDWSTKFFSQEVQESQHMNLLYMDNLDAQTSEEFKQSLAESCNTVPHYLTANATDEIQPVDDGVGKAMKSQSVKILERRLIEDPELHAKW